MTITMVAIDEHVLLRMGLSRIVGSCPDIALIGEASNCAEALEVVPQLRPDVITVGLVLPDNDGVSTAIALRQELPDVGVILLTEAPSDSVVLRAMGAGLSALVSKAAPAPTIIAAIRYAAQSPHTFNAPGLAAVLRRASQQSLLSQRELQVLALMRDGRTLPAIAAEMQVSLATVKTYVARLYTKLKVNNRAQALITAANLGLLADEAA